jgi:fructuronate reductase
VKNKSDISVKGGKGMIDLKKWQDSVDELNHQQVVLPAFDTEAVRGQGRKAPVWLHFGGGNLYRGFHAEIAQCLAEKQELQSGVVVCETFDEELIEKGYQAFDSQFLEVIMKEDGTLEKRLNVITAESLFCHPSKMEEHEKAAAHFKNPSLQFATFTITEKGYALKNQAGDYLEQVKKDIQNGPEKAEHTISIVTALLYQRFLAGELPIAMVSTDNFSQNGKRFKNVVLEIAEQWKDNGLVRPEFLAYLKNKAYVSFPWSMIDRITPNPSKEISAILEKEGFADMQVIHTAKWTNIAPFANTETTHYLVVEDSFPNGRPDLAAAGVILTDRDTVEKTDAMKVTACLNPLHTALAIFGCLLGYTSIAEEMKDPDLSGLVKEIGYSEGLPVVEDPGILDPKKFLDEVIEQRFPNVYIPDTPQRIATDTSQKLAIRFGGTIEAYLNHPEKQTSDLVFIPLTIAAWLRYLIGKDDQGQVFELSPDPLTDPLQEMLSGIQLGEQDLQKIHEAAAPILSNPSIFSVDLYEAGIGEQIEKDFCKLLAGTNAVRETLHHYLSVHGRITNNGNDI